MSRLNTAREQMATSFALWKLAPHPFTHWKSRNVNDFLFIRNIRLCKFLKGIFLKIVRFHSLNFNALFL